jgi:hypothetical protein
MIIVPAIRILASFALYIRAGTFRTELERMVVHKLSGLGVFTISLGLAPERAYHL